MKKLPIILSSLALAGAVMPASPALAMTELTDDDYIQPGETINTVQGGIWVTQVYPLTASVTIDISHYAATEGRQLSNIYLALYDYKSGVSIAEADERAKKLGEMQFEPWMGRTLDYAVTSQSISRTIQIGYINLINEYPADIIYYAFKLENPDNPEVATEWIRGKVDYRECVHSSPFETGKASICRLMQNGTTGEYYYSPKGYGRTSSPVLSWPAELRMLIEGQWDTIDTDVKELERRHEDYQTISVYSINGETRAVDDFETLVNKIGQGEAYATEITEMRERIEALRTPKERPIEPEPEEPEEPEKPDGSEEPEKPGSEGTGEVEGPDSEETGEVEEPKKPEAGETGGVEDEGGTEPGEGSEETEETGGLGGAESEDGASGGSSSTGAEKNPEITNGLDENAYSKPLGGAQSDEKSETQSDGSMNVAGATTASTSLTAQNNAGVAPIFSSNAFDSSEDDGEDEESEEDDADEEADDEIEEDEVELPKLGEEERSFWWLWVILIIMAGGFAVWRVRRSGLKKGKNSL